MTIGCDLLFYGLLAKAEAVAKRDRAVFFLQSDADAQIAGCKRALSRKVNHRAIGRGAEAILTVSHLVEDLRSEKPRSCACLINCTRSTVSAVKRRNPPSVRGAVGKSRRFS